MSQKMIRFELPEEPTGATRAITYDTGSGETLIWEKIRGGAYQGMWQNLKGGRMWWHELLVNHGPVDVERTPRVFDALLVSLTDLGRFRGKSGTVYVLGKESYDYPAYVPVAFVGELSEWQYAASLSHWREIDGPLTEVFDDE